MKARTVIAEQIVEHAYACGAPPDASHVTDYILSALDAAGFVIVSTVVCPSCKAEFLPAASPPTQPKEKEKPKPRRMKT